MRIFLVRHGESISNVDASIYAELSDHVIPLSDKGKTQAEEAGAFLRDYFRTLPRDEAFSPVRLWTSPYRRTRETAHAIETVIGDSVPLDRREHINLCEQQFGLFDGVPDEELPVRFPNEYAHYKKCVDHEGKFWARVPLGESRFDVAVRVRETFGTFLRDAERWRYKNIIVICHGVTLRAFVMQWLHLTPEWFEAEPTPGNCWIRLIDDAGDQGYIYRKD
ncbi:MAG: hypothetical protein GKS00_17000 [Alphaproteobacteria bacterium]|nr:hypothetical protein [Alphaproteobacteria bacterium]